MKRSTMVSINAGDYEGYTTIANDILKVCEANGMLPPMHPMGTDKYGGPAYEWEWPEPRKRKAKKQSK